MIYTMKYETPDGFSNMIMRSDGEYLTALWFEGASNPWDGFNEEKKKEMIVNDGQLQIFHETVRWLDSYFKGEIPKFIPQYRIDGMTDFRKGVVEIMLTVGYGETITYGDIAKRMAIKRGCQRMSSQAVGGAVGWNPICIIIPCHRVWGRKVLW